MNLNPVLEILKRRRSVRAFSDKPVPAEIKEELFRAAFRAPTAGAMMLYTILDITDQAIKDKLAVSCDDQPFIASSPVVLIFLADYQRMYDYFLACGVKDLCAGPGREMRIPGEGDLLLACSDALIAAQNSVVAAESLGLGSCYIGDIMEQWEFHRDLLNLPEYAFPIAMVCYGYPKKEKPSGRPVPRYDRKYLISENTYKRIPPEELPAMTDPLEDFGKTIYIQGAGNYGQHIYLQKFDSEYSREMTRSVREALKNWRK